MQKLRKCFITPYFGKFPAYFPKFLESVQSNPSFDWIFLTNDHTSYNYPGNTFVFYTSFEECKKQIAGFFNFEIVLNRPYKLCDYKPSYGYVFAKYLKDYDYWGYCDVDLIYGDLAHFYPDELIIEYDKIGSSGHFSLYRNQTMINKLFMSSYNGIFPYKIAFTTDVSLAFDEWHSKFGSINHFIEAANRPFYQQEFCLNFSTYFHNFRETTYDHARNLYGYLPTNGIVVSKQNGKIYKHELKGNKLITKEYSYIHLHKRRMECKLGGRDKNYLIVPNQFIPLKENINEVLIKKYAKKPIISSQYINTKMNNLKTKLKIFFGLRMSK